MELKKGAVVRVKAGRGKGAFFVVLEVLDGYVLLCDGKERKLDHPKRKNLRHIALTKTVLPLQDITDKKLRQFLRAFGESAGDPAPHGR